MIANSKGSLVALQAGGNNTNPNSIAIAAGFCDGLGLGDNTKAALITRGLAEMTRLGICMGAKEYTFAGLTGIGDLVVTCTSRHSRNNRFGYKVGSGVAIDKALEYVKEGKGNKIPNHLLDTHYEGSKALGHGENYKYPHSYKNHYVKQQYLPDDIRKEIFYEYQENKVETTTKKYWEDIKK